MRPTLCLLVAALAAPLTVGCAAPAEDDDPGMSDQADSVDILAVKKSEMKSALASATLETREDRIFQYGISSVAVAPNTQSGTYCYFRLSRSSGGTVRGVPKGDVYSFDGNGMALSSDRDSTSWTWTLPLVNERTQAGTAKAVADFAFGCTSRQPLSAKQIVEILQNGKTDTGEPSAARLVGAR